MRSYVYLLTAALISSFFVYPQKTTALTQQIESQHHQFHIDPDVFVSSGEGRYVDEKIDLSFSSNAVFGGLRLGYEYLKPQAFYFGTDALVSLGRSVFKAEALYWSEDNLYVANQKIKERPFFANIEQRCGYTFQRSVVDPIFIPFAGIGQYYTRSQFDSDDSSQNWTYGATGLRITQEFSENFNVGVNLKAMYAFAGKIYSPEEGKVNIREGWGYELALPLTWASTRSGKADVQFQPYLVKLDAESSSYILGARLQSGYKF